MIDDLSAARPQSGLHLADVVWQAPAEGGIPRYMAVFQTHLPKAIGPVRSARSYYVAWASELKALYAHAGGSPQALATLRAKGAGQYVYNADVFRWEGRFFHRIHTRSAPHNVYTSGALLRKLETRLGAKDKAFKWPWVFGPDAPLEDRPYGGTIKAVYPANTITYRYDRKSNTLPALGEPRGQAGRRERQEADRAKERDHHGRLVRGHRRQEASPRGGPRRQRPRLDLDQRPDRQGDLEEERDQQADPLLRSGRQAGHADGRTDVHPGPATRLVVLDQDRQRHGSEPAGRLAVARSVADADALAVALDRQAVATAA